MPDTLLTFFIKNDTTIYNKHTSIKHKTKKLLKDEKVIIYSNSGARIIRS